MKKKANALKKGDSVKIAGKSGIIEEFEISDIGKQGTKKVRMIIKMNNGEKITIIRPKDYPFETE